MSQPKSHQALKPIESLSILGSVMGPAAINMLFVLKESIAVHTFRQKLYHRECIYYTEDGSATRKPKTLEQSVFSKIHTKHL